MRSTIAVAQVRVSDSVGSNVGRLIDAIHEARSGDLLVTPEAAVTGRVDDPAALQTLDPASLASACEEIVQAARAARVDLWLGT